MGTLGIVFGRLSEHWISITFTSGSGLQIGEPSENILRPSCHCV